MTIEQNVRLCAAGHELVQFWCIRCPVCAVIERLDRELLKVEIERDVARALADQLMAMRDYTGGPA